MEFIREDCIYARQSVDRKDSISIESQIDFCKYELKGGSCRVFKDKGYSGKNTDRPEFQKLLGEIRKGKVRRVIVYKLDRISRSILDFATMMELFQEYDVEFVSSTEKFDTSTPMGRAMLNICIVFAQLERETIQKRVTDAYYSRCLNNTGYFRCTKRTENKGCPGCGKIRKEEFEQFIFSAMQEKFKDFQILHGREEKVNPKLTAYQVELAQVEAEIEKLLDTLTGANATLLAYANKKIEELDTRRQTISKAIAELSVETISPQQIKKLSYYLDNWESIDFDDKRKAADGLISTIKATSDRVQIEWKI